MQTAALAGFPLSLPEIPTPFKSVIEELRARGADAAFTGPCVADWFRGDTPAAVEITTTASKSEVLATFRNGVGIRPTTAMLPTSAGPVDITSVESARGIGGSLRDRDFTQHAMAYDPIRSQLFDPFEGRLHLGKGRLCAVGAPEAALAADPLRALRALRLVSTQGVELEEHLARALGAVAAPLARSAPNRLRFELCSLLMGSEVAAALTLMRTSGIEQRLASGVRDDAARVVAALPFDRVVRLAGWLRGANAADALRRLRFPRREAQRIDLLVHLHPVDVVVQPERVTSVRRLLKRAGEENVRVLMAFRGAELDAEGAAPDSAGRRWIEALASGIERVGAEAELASRRSALAIDGAGVMEVLGCPAGPTVGLALRHLAECVGRDPSCNERDRLVKLLADWTPPEHDADRVRANPAD